VAAGARERTAAVSCDRQVRVDIPIATGGRSIRRGAGSRSGHRARPCFCCRTHRQHGFLCASCEVSGRYSWLKDCPFGVSREACGYQAANDRRVPSARAYECPVDCFLSSIAALPRWLHSDSWHRPHASLAGQPSMFRPGLSRSNLLRLHSSSPRRPIRRAYASLWPPVSAAMREAYSLRLGRADELHRLAHNIRTCISSATGMSPI
jgi:hypothetical protein